VIDVGYNSAPRFGDIDGDGDLDLLVGNDNGTIYYFRNDGKKTSPVWRSSGLLLDAGGSRIKVGNYSAPALMDVDGDGDLDLFIGEYYGTVIFYENTGTKTNPGWTFRGPIKDAGGNTIDVGWSSIPTFADINGDGLQDLLVGEHYGNVIHYQNTGTGSTPKWTLVGALNDVSGSTISVGYNSAPALADMDGDGDLDLVIGSYYGAVAYYSNTGTPTAPVWTSIGPMKDAGGAGITGTPAFVDINNDGLKEFFTGNYYGGMSYYRNVGTAASPSWKLLTSKYNSIGVDSYAIPALCDIDGDGDLDMLVGEYAGDIVLYKNEGDAKTPAWVPSGFLADKDGNTIDVGYNSAPALADIGNTGLLDLFVGESSGKVIRYQNAGTQTAPQWTLVGPITDAKGTTISVGYNSTPVFGDLDGDGDLDLLIGEYHGKVTYYRNDGNGTSVKWTYVGPLKDAGDAVINVGYSSRPAIVDIDGDGKLDLIVGEYYGKLYYYRNAGDAHAPVWNLSSTSYDSIDVQNCAAPAFGDIDNDDDPDLFVGNSYGSLYFYPMQGATRHLYENPDTYHPTLRVTGSGGLTATDSVTVLVLPSGSPSAQAKASPTSGNVPMTVNFSGKGVDPNGSITNYEWDYNGDGTYEWSNPSSPNSSYTFNKVGTFNATLRVTDNEGNRATDSVTINATLGIAATRTGIFKPGLGEKASVCNSYTDSAKVTVKIIDAAGNVVKVLVNEASRDKGTTYCDEWDGRNTAGKLVPDGIYYYLIEYTVNGQKFTYDPRMTAGYKETPPSRSWTSTFNPYQNKFVEITYSTDKPSEIGLQMWTLDCSAPDCVKLIRTVYTREPEGAGSHKALWDGIDDRGIPVTVGDYAVRLWAYELADNAIIVSGNRPAIDALSAAPNYFTSGYNPYRSGSILQPSVSFSLSKNADLEVRIINSLGVVVRKMSKSGLSAGANSIVWDGKDQSGKAVFPGGYSIQMTAVDAAGNRSLPRYASIILSE
jgi:flagellar hook assembly protein FlgD